MAAKTVYVSQPQTKPIKILKWKVREGNTIPIGRIILVFDFEGAEKCEQRKLKSTQAGTIQKIIAQEGVVVNPGDVLLQLEACSHPTIMNDMCAECGADLRKDELSTIASVPMVHSIPDLKVSEELAQKLGKADSERLIKDRKLVLLVDLDQTLIHTTNDNIPPNIKDVYHFQLYGSNSPWYHTRLRPGTHKFLSNINSFFELHICTFGARNYAHMIAMFLDGDQKFFSNRILSRDECFDPTSKKANLSALFPCGDNMVCIIDDREDVWSHAKNLIHVKPYHFFQHTGDINAPPGLDKQENDDKAGVDLSKIKEKVKNDVKDTNGCDKENGNNLDEGNDKTEEENVKEKVSEEKTKEDDLEEPKNEDEKDKDEKEDTENNVDSKNKVESLESSSVSNTETNEKKGEETKINNTEECKESEEKPKEKDDDSLIEIEDPDDYLVYLEDVLKRIHDTFYEQFDKLESGEVPDLKKVIPSVRNLVLKGSKLAFSGLVPTHIKLEQSKAYQVAKSLGAEVTQDLEDDTTHLVAVRPGTAKVNAGKRKKNLKIVTPDWLWSCAERWEHVDERIFPLNQKGSKNRHPPPHCSSPDHTINYPEHGTPGPRKRTASGRFMDTINPLMSFSTADIADMDKEVEDILDDESESSSGEETGSKPVREVIPKEAIESSSSSSSEDSMTGEYPKGYKRKRTEIVEDNSKLDDLNDSSEEEEESPSIKFRRGEQLDSDFDVEESQGSEGSTEMRDDADDADWNMIGAALEREFLSNN